MGWKSDYVALFDEKAGKIDVQGWLTLTNRSGTTYSNANTLLVAGAVGRGSRGAYSAMEPGTQTAGRERIGDFYGYSIAGRITIAERPQQQVSFLDLALAPAANASP